MRWSYHTANYHKLLELKLQLIKKSFTPINDNAQNFLTRLQPILAAEGEILYTTKRKELISRFGSFEIQTKNPALLTDSQLWKEIFEEMAANKSFPHFVSALEWACTTTKNIEIANAIIENYPKLAIIGESLWKIRREEKDGGSEKEVKVAKTMEINEISVQIPSMSFSAYSLPSELSILSLLF